MTEFSRTLRWLLHSALRLLLLLKPRPIDPRRVGPGHVLGAALVFVLAVSAIDAWLAQAPRQFEVWGILAMAGVLALVGTSGLVVAAVGRRPALRHPVAALLLLTLSAQALVLHALRTTLDPDWRWLTLLAGVWTLLMLWRLLAGIDPRSSRWQRLSATIAGSALVVATLVLLPRWPIIDTDWELAYDTYGEETPDWPRFDAERLIYQQQARIDAALDALAAQRPGKPDLYFLAFGADGSERVFAQEADYAARLVAQRFDAEGRTLVLGNDLRAPEQRPLATLSNLRHALAGLGRIIDKDEDIVFLFLTTHGSENHRLYVHLPPLPLTQITPSDLRDALDDAGIRWRVLLVSACYSGGFVEALSDATTLVMTAARADRSSFGCGPESEITWFGRAYFAEALNGTGDLLAAFHIARDLIAEWEEAEDFAASDPQISSTPLIETKLRAWTESVDPGPALAFEGATDSASTTATQRDDELEFGER